MVGLAKRGRQSMKAFDALKRFFRPSDTTIALPSDPFIVIDRDQAKSKLRLEERARRNAAENFPRVDANNYDDVELEIIAEFSEHASRAQIDAAGHHRSYNERLSELGLLRELSSITAECRKASGDFRTTIINRTGSLAVAKDAIRESYVELADFKRTHGLENRPAHRGINSTYAWSGVAVAWLFESAFNTAFLRVNDEFGLLGGFIAAAVIALVNILLSAFVGKIFWPYFFHKDALQKRLAFVGTFVWVIFLVIWNLYAAHFRDEKAAGSANPESTALPKFLEAPLHFDSIYSYGLIIFGILFAFISAAVAFRTDDPYPGYGATYRRHVERCDEYAAEIEVALEELTSTRDQAIESAHDIRNELGVQFRERGQIIAGRSSLRSRFREQQEYLEATCNALLGVYRSENERARPDKLTPEHFKTKWVLKKTDLPDDLDEPSIDDEVLRAQELLIQSIENISDAYSGAIESFEHLDKIKESLTNGKENYYSENA